MSREGTGEPRREGKGLPQRDQARRLAVSAPWPWRSRWQRWRRRHGRPQATTRSDEGNGIGSAPLLRLPEAPGVAGGGVLLGSLFRGVDPAGQGERGGPCGRRAGGAMTPNKINTKAWDWTPPQSWTCPSCGMVTVTAAPRCRRCGFVERVT